VFHFLRPSNTSFRPQSNKNIMGALYLSSECLISNSGWIPKSGLNERIRLPGPAQHQDVEVPVVIEIGLAGVEGVDLVVKAGRAAAMLKRAITYVDEQ
jgi:hypothetical protein